MDQIKNDNMNANMELSFSEKSKDYGMIGVFLFILFNNIISKFFDVQESTWFMICSVITNLGLLYTLISLIGYYYQNYSLKEIFKHPMDAILAISICLYFIVLQIVPIFVYEMIPFIHLTF